jgi:hypothetical protein
VLPDRLFAVRQLALALMVSGPTTMGETVKAALALGALASALADLSQADLERLQAAKRELAPAGPCSPAEPRSDGSDKPQATS